MYPGRIHLRNPRKRSAHRNKRIPRFVQKPDSQRGRRSAAAVVRRASAKADHQARHLRMFQRMGNELTHSVCGGTLRAAVFSHQRKSCRRHFDHGRAAAQAVKGFQPLPVRSLHHGDLPASSHGSQKSVDTPLSAVRHGDLLRLHLRPERTGGTAHLLTDFQRRHGSFKRIRDKHQLFHVSSPSHPSDFPFSSIQYLFFPVHKRKTV